MSVVIVTADNYSSIRNTMTYLRKQTVKGQLEIVIVAPSADKLDIIDSELEDFHGVQVVEVGPIETIAWANAAGIRKATAPIVVLAEDHCYPDPQWAESLIAAHRQPWAAVGPVVQNANPNNAVSWADLFIGYGPWLDPSPAGVVDHLPGHNSSYKRSILLDYGPELDSMLEAESVLHWDLRARGYQLYLEPAAKVSHLNFSLLSSWIPVQFHCGRVFAAARSINFSLLTRILYICGAPLIPLVRLWRIIREIRGRGVTKIPCFRVLPLLLLGLIFDSVGQAIGYAFGTGPARRKLSNFEFHREFHLTQQDKQAKLDRLF
jgi:GT2 family glycosyltransferase